MLLVALKKKDEDLYYIDHFAINNVGSINPIKYIHKYEKVGKIFKFIDIERIFTDIRLESDIDIQIYSSLFSETSFVWFKETNEHLDKKDKIKINKIEALKREFLDRVMIHFL